MKRIIPISLVFISVIAVSVSVSTNTRCAEKKRPAQRYQAGPVAEDHSLNDSVTYQLIPGINNTWGYDILAGNKVLIHQPCIPGLPGNDGFKTKEGAEKVARLVISKIKKGEEMPGITEEELKELKVI